MRDGDTTSCLLPFDACIDLAPIKHNRHVVVHNVLGNKIIIFIFHRIYEITFQNISHQKFVSLVIDNLN